MKYEAVHSTADSENNSSSGKEQKRETGVILKSRYCCNILNHKRSYGWDKSESRVKPIENFG